MRDMKKKKLGFSLSLCCLMCLVTCVWKGVRDSEWKGARGWDVYGPCGSVTIEPF